LVFVTVAIKVFFYQGLLVGWHLGSGTRGNAVRYKLILCHCVWLYLLIDNLANAVLELNEGSFAEKQQRVGHYFQYFSSSSS
jgi:hypothetical protein